MIRDIKQSLSDWKSRVNRKPLIIRGARQVGKTYAIEHFAKENFKTTIKINLEENPEYKKVFHKNDAVAILNELSVLSNTSYEFGHTLLFIDEIQTCPEAITILRYFYEQLPQLHVIAAGSLLDHTLNEMKLSMPVGRVEFMHMYPLSFREFLHALREEKLISYMDNYSMNESFSEAIHLKLLEFLRYYIFIGGMPEPVKLFCDSQNLSEIERIHNGIINSLRYDFAKYGTRSQQQHLNTVLRHIGQNSCVKLKYANIDSEVRSGYIKDAIKLLELSKVITVVRHTSSGKIPLSQYANETIFKAFFLDIGLSNSMNKIQLFDLLRILTHNEGAIAEQFVGQELLTLLPAYQEPELYYWVREQKSASAEIDYLYQHKNRIIPIEVKAGKSGSLKSLQVYLLEKKLDFGIRFNTDLPTIGNFNSAIYAGSKSETLNYNLLSLPLYMVHQLPRILNSM